MNLRRGRGGGRTPPATVPAAGGRGARGESDAGQPPPLPAPSPSLGRTRPPGRWASGTPAGRRRGARVPLCPGGREGRMWSLSSQTSSRNLPTSRHLPPAAPGPGEPRGWPAAPSPARSPRHPEHPQPAKRSGRGKQAPREGGWGRGGGRGLGLPHPPSRALSAPAPAPRPGSSPAPHPRRARAARVTSGQIQRDVLLAAVIPPCARQTHSPS